MLKSNIQMKPNGELMIKAENQPLPPPPPPPAAPVAKDRRKTWIAIALVAILAVALVGAVLAFTNPNILANGQTIDLSYNYKVGQKMTYQMDLSTNVPFLGPQTQTITISERVVDFNGSIYTIEMSASIPGSTTQTTTMKMDKSGRITDYGDLDSTVQQTFNSLFSMPGFGSYFPQQSVKVGETWTIPLDSSVLGFNIQGTVTNKIDEIKSISTPAGTFEAFKTEMTTQMQLTTNDPSGQQGAMSLNANGYSYMEKGTCVPLDFTIDLSMGITSLGQTQTMTATMSMKLLDFNRGT